MTAPSLFRLAAVLILAAPLALYAEEKPSPIPLKTGDRVVFLGDSITEAGAGAKGYISIIRSTFADKHKDTKVEFLGAGISGNKVPDLQNRLDRDVLAKKPTVVFIYIGINDVWHGEKDPAKGTSKEAYKAGLEDVIKRIQGSGARVILCTPTVIGEKKDGANKNDAKLDEYSAISRAVAKDLKVPVCDLRTAFIMNLKTHNPDNKDRGILTGDGVHLNDAGNKFVAEQLMSMFGE
jgi:lysophospholipase L1-like esterase